MMNVFQVISLIIILILSGILIYYIVEWVSANMPCTHCDSKPAPNWGSMENFTDDDESAISSTDIDE